MGKINMTRVVLGGLIAGLVINLGEFLLNEIVLGKKWEEAMKALNRPPVGNELMVFFVLLSFALGVFAVWVYAAIRPRFGAGPMTAICAGLIVWFLASLYASAGIYAMRIFPGDLLLYGTAWQVIELPVAVLLGAYFYKEP